MTDSDSFLDDILFVIVLYQQSLVNCESFTSLSGALSGFSRVTFFVYDNSPQACAVPPLNSVFVEYHHDPANPGVGKAYNEGYKVAFRLKKKWLFLADQDTTFPATIIFDYWHAIQKYPQQHIFVPRLYDTMGSLSPFRLIWGKGMRIKRRQEAKHGFEKLKAINSGMLVSLEAFERANGYDERFALDYSDISFCDRLAKHDPGFILIPTKCHHNFSATFGKVDLPTEMHRFKSFCRAVRLYKKVSLQLVVVPWIVLPRALKLSLKWRSLTFLAIGFEHTLYG